MTREEMKFPWSIQDTIENLKELKVILQEQLKRKNYEGQGERDSKEIGIDFDRAIEALEKQGKCGHECSKCWKTKLVTDTNVDSKWIPCSEMLPPIDMSYPNAKDYLVYYEHGYYDVASYSNINRFWHEHITEPYWNCSQYCKVVAWQPLPEPYKEGET